MGDIELTKKERLVEIFRRMSDASPASSGEEAYRLLCDTINAVEDEMTNIPYDPPTPPDDDGRIYPPFDDHRKPVTGRPDLRRYVSRGHTTIIGDNGAITIMGRDKIVVFSKLGSDGNGTD